LEISGIIGGGILTTEKGGHGDRRGIPRSGAEGEEYKDCLPWFYSRGFAPFAGNALGGFAAEVGRFGETTLPLVFIRWDLRLFAVPNRSPG
jgi:hypothetical protein